MKKWILLTALLAGVVIFSGAQSADMAMTGSAANSPLIWNTFLGGSGADVGRDITLDSNGNIYVVGKSDSTWGNPLHPYGGGVSDVFVSKFDANGNLQWNTFMGLTESDEKMRIAIDGKGNNIYVIGGKCESGLDGNGHMHYSGVNYLNKLDADGNLQWSILFDPDVLENIAVDDQGNVFVIGFFYWNHTNICSVYKFNSNGEGKAIFALEGTELNQVNDIAVDDSGNIYIAGNTDGVVFVGKLDLDTKETLKWKTPLGGDYHGHENRIALDSRNNIYVTGYSDYTWGNPLNPYNKKSDVFLTKLNAGNGLLQWSTFLGGSGDDHGDGIALDDGGNIYLTGSSDSTWGRPWSPFGGESDAFITKINAKGVLQWNTFLGGSGSSFGIALDGCGHIYAGGTSHATWGNPLGQHNGGLDAFLAQLAYGVKVTSPNGGESWTFNSLQDVTWKAPGLAGNVALNLYRNGARIGWIANCPASRGFYTWKAGTYEENLLPVPVGGGYAIQVTGSGNSDMSDGTFSIYKPIPSLELTSPKGGESWRFKSQQYITWKAPGMTGNVALSLYRNGRKVGWIANCPATRGSYSWKVGTYEANLIPVPAGSGYSIMITRPGLAAASAGMFTIFR